MSEDLLHVDTVVVVDADDGDHPKAGISGLIDQEVDLVNGRAKYCTPLILSIGSCIWSTNFILVLSDKAFQPCDVFFEAAVQFADFNDPVLDCRRQRVLVRRVEVVTRQYDVIPKDAIWDQTANPGGFPATLRPLQGQNSPAVKSTGQCSRRH